LKIEFFQETISMFVFGKKRIAADTSGEEIRRITTILEQNKIKYEIRTKRTRGSIGTAIDARTYARANLAMYKGAQSPPVVYMIWVKREDYEQAVDLCF
jgi:hypothetical protein